MVLRYGCIVYTLILWYNPFSHSCSCSRTFLSVYPPRPTRLTSPEGLGMSGGEDSVGVSGDGGGVMDDPLKGPLSDIGNTCSIA